MSKPKQTVFIVFDGGTHDGPLGVYRTHESAQRAMNAARAEDIAERPHVAECISEYYIEEREVED